MGRANTGFADAQFVLFLQCLSRDITVFVHIAGKIYIRNRQEGRGINQMNGIEVVGLLLLLLALSVPLSVSMGIAGITYIVIAGIPLSVIAHRMGNAVNSFPLLAVPVFIFAGGLMNTSGITTRIFDFAKLLIGPIRGGLAQVNVIASLIFSGISGAALADIGGLGQIEIKAMEEQGYKSELAAGITAASATIGPIFPPSIPLIIYGTVAEVSGVKLLIAGVVPGLLITFLLMLQIGYFARKYNFPTGSRAFKVKEVFHAFRNALPALLAPVILIGGLLSGFFSPTEVAAVTVFYGLILGKFIYKELTWQQLAEVGRQSIRQTANIMFIISSAAIFAFALTVEQVPVQMTDMLLGISKNPVVLLLIVNVLLLVVGMIMETIAAILVLTPLLVPALSQAGVDPIHLGIVMVLNLMIGLLTPPVGMSLYMVSIVSETPVEKVIRAILPYFLPLILSLIIVTLLPMISTWLPGLLY